MGLGHVLHLAVLAIDEGADLEREAGEDVAGRHRPIILPSRLDAGGDDARIEITEAGQDNLIDRVTLMVALLVVTLLIMITGEEKARWVYPSRKKRASLRWEAGSCDLRL